MMSQQEKPLLQWSVYDIIHLSERVAEIIYAHQIIERDEQLLEKVGRILTLETALKTKKINPDLFLIELEEVLAIERQEVEGSLKCSNDQANQLVIKGILPCPVRVPLLEAFEIFISQQSKEQQAQYSYEFYAASMGTDWLANIVRQADNEEELPDLFMSAGFELFFDKELIGKFRQRHVFKDLTDWSDYQPSFNQIPTDLRDPLNEYSILGVVPAIFLVNQDELQGRPSPKGWADILRPEFEGSISLPVGDFDLFTGILLTIHKYFGEEGLKALGRNFVQSLHPSEMIHSYRKEIKPVVTIMPYFFSRMARHPMTVVWPEEGAIISPIFMLTKASKANQLQPIVDFMSSLSVAKIFSHQGLFPSTHPQIDNRLTAEKSYLWLGWETLRHQDMGALINYCRLIFEKTVEGQSSKNHPRHSQQVKSDGE